MTARKGMWRLVTACLLAVLAGAVASQNTAPHPTYPTILAAIQDPALNLTKVAKLMNQVLNSSTDTSLFAFLTNATFQGVMLLPTDTAFQAFKSITHHVNISNSMLASILLYHVLPDETINNQQVTYPTLLPSSANVTGSWTIAPFTATQNLIGGVVPGSLQQMASFLTAANAILYLTDDNVLIPPTNPDIFGQPFTLSITDFLAGTGNYTQFLNLVNKTQVGLLADVDTMITLFAPSDAGFRSANLNLASMSVNDVKALIFNHMLAEPFPGTFLQPGQVYSPLYTYANQQDVLTLTAPASPSQPLTVQGVGNTSPVNVTGIHLSGKSIIYEIDGVLLPSAIRFPTEPALPSPLASPPPATPSTSTTLPPPPSPSSPSPVTNLSTSPIAAKSSTLPQEAVAGIAAGVALLVLFFAAIVVWVWRNRRRAGTLNNAFLPQKAAADATAHIGMRLPDAHIMDAAMDIPGLAKGEVFTRATAHSYQWSAVSPEQQQAMVAVEAGITDMALEGSNGATGHTTATVQLTKQEVQQQIQLLTQGLLGKGATGLVFKCTWPSRFGPNALLAAKVMKDGFESDASVLQSFLYEARVLASIEPPHPNVVRLYGYCLEPPTVCLIMELLPCSLKDVLYKGVDFKQGMSSRVADKTRSGMIRTGPSELADIEVGQSHATASTSEGTNAAVVSTSSAPSHDNMGLSATPDRNHNRTSTLTTRCVLQICIDIAAGLKHLHEKPLAPELATAAGSSGAFEEEGALSMASSPGVSLPGRKNFKIVHRDLKPANILFNSAGLAKISDFGLARPQHGTTLITEHIGAGTLPYMAPELLAGSTLGLAAAVPASNRVDIYSTGMIMWETLAGCMPWRNMNNSALAAAVLSGRRPQLPLANEEVNMPAVSSSVLGQPPGLDVLPEFNAIIRACWQHREQRRPTAEELHSMLTALLAKLENDGNLLV